MAIPLDVIKWASFVEDGIDLGKSLKEMLEQVPQEIVQQVIEWMKPPIVIGGGGVIKGGRTRREWEHTFSSSNGPLWRDLRKYLLQVVGRDKSDVHQLDVWSDKVLFLLGDPKEKGELDSVKGLVVGYVQSGKTANYTALTAKAFDAGFKIVIILSGIHNSLRRQTQVRVANELGLIASTSERPTASKNGPKGPDSILAGTSEDLANGDFQYSHFQSNLLSRGRSIFVTKKNAYVLSKLLEWIGENAKDIPALIIDDEADQATVNTKGGKKEYQVLEGDQPKIEDLDVTKINELVRKLVKAFNNVSYVGYTATPYANVFIPMDEKHSVLDDDLYPKDFIVSLPKPQNYMGPEEFFGSEVTGDVSALPTANVIRIVDDSEIAVLDTLPSPVDGQNALLPDDLKHAIRTFVLATAAKRTFDGFISPTSMLIHASHLKEKQKPIAQHVKLYVESLREEWRYFESEAQLTWAAEWEQLSSEFTGKAYLFSFDEIKKELGGLLGKFSSLPVLLLNYSSDDELDYESNPNLTAIVVGGNKLSRGLTLEGLLTSYFVRKANAPKADTLTQMGRFFGYRQQVVDLTRLYTTDDLRSAFVEITLVEEALRNELATFEKENKTPRDFAPRVLKRKGLMPTAGNKMRSAQAGGTSYSGDLVQTTSFPSISEMSSRKQDAPPKLVANYDLACRFIARLLDAFGDPESIGTSLGDTYDSSWRAQARWSGVPTSFVLDFLRDYKTVAGATRFVPSGIASYINELSKVDDKKLPPELTNWTVAIVGRIPTPSLGTENFGSRFVFGRIERSLVEGSDSSIGVLVNPLDLAKGAGDELINLSDNQLNQARQLKASDSSVRASYAVRAVRDASQGLLILYPISPNSKGDGQSTAIKGKRRDKSIGEVLFEGQKSDITIIGAAVSFPVSPADRIQEVWAQNMNKGGND